MMQNYKTTEVSGVKFTLFPDEYKITNLAEMPNVMIFRDTSLGEIPFSLKAEASTTSSLTTKTLYTPALALTLTEHLSQWLKGLGYEDFTESFTDNTLLRAVSAVRWEVNEQLTKLFDPSHVPAALGKLGTSTSKVFGDMYINSIFKVMMYRRVSRGTLLTTSNPLGTWECDGEQGYLLASGGVATGVNIVKFFLEHLPEDISQLEQEFSDEYSRRWPKYPKCTFKIFDEYERREAYYKLIQR